MSFLQMSLTGGVMIAVSTLLRALAMNHVPKKTFLALWGAALVRLRQPEAVVSKRRSAARKKIFFIIIQRKRYRYRSLSCMSALCSS